MVQRTDFGSAARVLAWLDSAGWVSGQPSRCLSIATIDTSCSTRAGSRGEVLLFSESRDERTISLLQRLGLSRREAEVLLLLADGRPPQGRPPCSALVRAP